MAIIASGILYTVLYSDDYPLQQAPSLGSRNQRGVLTANLCPNRTTLECNKNLDFQPPPPVNYPWRIPLTEHEDWVDDGVIPMASGQS